MIVRVFEQQYCYCSGCGKKKHFTRKQQSDPDAMFELMESFTKKHEDCG